MSEHLDRELAEAFQRQGERAAASMQVNRTGWTTEQWCEDADRLMNEEDGAITSLVNGHVLALLRVWREQTQQLCGRCLSALECMNAACPDKDRRVDVTPGHPVREGAGFDCACGLCEAGRTNG